MSETFDTNPPRLLRNSTSYNIGGLIYYGVVNGDPVNNVGDRIDIFGDRALSVALPNPVTTGSDGRPEVSGQTVKVHVGSRYSLFEHDSADVEQYQDLDRGENPSVGATITLSNVQGINVLTAQASPAITEYSDKQEYVFTVAATNTDDVTLNIDNVGAKPFRFNFSEEIKPGFFQADQVVVAIFNSKTDDFSWDNSGRAISILTNVAGDGNAVTADGGPSVTGLVDNQLYQYKQNISNTLAVTLKIGVLDPKSIVDSNGLALGLGALKLNTLITVSFDAGEDRFQLSSGSFAGKLGFALNTNGFPINTSRFTVASAATTADIWASPGGNEVDFTGTATVTDFPDAPRAGASRILHCAGAVVFTNNANLFVQGGANYTADAGDVVKVHAISVSTFRLTILKANGQSVVDVFGNRLLHMVEELAAQTDAGTFLTGANRNRDLNVLRVNEIPGASFNTGSALITLPIGKYRVEGSAPANSVAEHVVKFNSISGTAVALIGTREVAASGNQTRSFVYGTINPIVESTYRLQHQCQTTQNVNGFGSGASSNISTSNIFSECKIWRIS